jgi:hypothetical protein
MRFALFDNRRAVRLADDRVIGCVCLAASAYAESKRVSLSDCMGKDSNSVAIWPIVFNAGARQRGMLNRVEAALDQ